MTIRTGKGGRYRYHTCSIPMEMRDSIVASHVGGRLLHPDRLEEVLASVLDRHNERPELRDQAQVNAKRPQAMLESSGNHAVTPATIRRFADVACQRIRLDGGIGGITCRRSPRGSKSAKPKFAS